MKYLFISIFFLLSICQLQSQSPQSKLYEHILCNGLKAGPAKDKPIKIKSSYHDINAKLKQNFQQSNRERANIVVTYSNNFPQAARNAFEYAAQIWESILISKADIPITVTWESLPSSDILAGASSNVWWEIYNNNDFPFNNTYYVYSLASHIVDDGYRVAGGCLLGDIECEEGEKYDVKISFNSNRNDWYFKTDANPRRNQMDFVSVALHEIGHGLGFDSNPTITNRQASLQYGGYPSIWDRFIENKSGQNLLTRPARSLYNDLIGKDLYFNGLNAKTANNGRRIKIYAPSTWENGSSYTHLDEDTYPNGLMTPILSMGDAIHVPDRIIKGVLMDLGWRFECSNNSDLEVEGTYSGNIKGGIYTASNNILVHGNKVGELGKVIFKAGNKIEITGSKKKPFKVSGDDFTAYVDKELCDFTTSTTHRHINLDDSQEVNIGGKSTNFTNGKIEMSLYPNPFSKTSNIQLKTANTEIISIELVNSYGKIEHEILSATSLPKGIHNYSIDGNMLPNGFYYILIKTKKDIFAKPLLLLKN